MRVSSKCDWHERKENDKEQIAALFKRSMAELTFDDQWEIAAVRTCGAHHVHLIEVNDRRLGKTDHMAGK